MALCVAESLAVQLDNPASVYFDDNEYTGSFVLTWLIVFWTQANDMSSSTLRRAFAFLASRFSHLFQEYCERVICEHACQSAVGPQSAPVNASFFDGELANSFVEPTLLVQLAVQGAIYFCIWKK
jgi:hypothetical protein